MSLSQYLPYIKFQNFLAEYIVYITVAVSLVAYTFHYIVIPVYPSRYLAGILKFSLSVFK